MTKYFLCSICLALVAVLGGCSTDKQDSEKGSTPSPERRTETLATTPKATGSSPSTATDDQIANTDTTPVPTPPRIVDPSITSSTMLQVTEEIKRLVLAPGTEINDELIGKVKEIGERMKTADSRAGLGTIDSRNEILVNFETILARLEDVKNAQSEELRKGNMEEVALAIMNLEEQAKEY